QHRVHPPSATTKGPALFIVNPRPAMALNEDEAVDRLGEHGLPFLFYTDPGTGRGNLLYRRYDANMGLTTPDSDSALAQP
ncbi:sigma 54 modulation/S30EA ribosomal C-terminal domain-containing protein, partial [Nocardia gipuzkoensis]